MKIKNIIFAICLNLTLPISIMSATTGCVQNYDNLVAADEACNLAWADVQANMQRRYDLIPNLVEIVKTSAKFEQTTLVELEKAQNESKSVSLNGNDFSDPDKLQQWQIAQNNLKNSIFVFQKVYPELQSNQRFKDLMISLEGTENRILRSREMYNKAVQKYNSELRRVRGQAINNLTGQPFKPRAFFVAEVEANKAPKINFN